MTQQGTEISKVKLHASEHFILMNLAKRLPHYALLWVVALVLGFVCSKIPWTQPVSDYAGMRAFSIAFITITTTTITFAIPTCMRTIFSAYDDYYSTKIKQILLMRFPVTLLALSAFTSLILSVAIVSGIIGIAIPVPPEMAFYVAVFWTLVCVVYLFIAIEKMVYFTVNAPYAVLDKLEYGVLSHKVLTSKADYDEFRVELSSMNDIASTIVSRSTGQDASVVSVLTAFKNIHKYYLTTANRNNPEQFKLHLNACRAVDHEMVRIFRTASKSTNEQACKTILRTYCEMLSDAFKTNTGVGYFADMMEQVPRIQSYAAASFVDEIRVSAFVEWFFMLSHSIRTEGYDRAKFALIVKTLSKSLRQAVIDGDNAVIYRFMRISANADLEYDAEQLNETWNNLLDRSVFVFLTWLIDALPDNAKTYMDYIRRYSIFDTKGYRSVLPDNAKRVESLIAYESLATLDNADSKEDTSKFVASSNHTALAMSISLEDNASHTLAMDAIMDHAGVSIEEISKMGRAGEKLAKEISELDNRRGDDEFDERLKLARVLDPKLLRDETDRKQ